MMLPLELSLSKRRIGLEGPLLRRRVNRAVAVSANFVDSYHIDPDMSIIKCQDRNRA